jgi:hypothetical protein
MDTQTGRLIKAGVTGAGGRVEKGAVAGAEGSGETTVVSRVGSAEAGAGWSLKGRRVVGAK